LESERLTKVKLIQPISSRRPSPNPGTIRLRTPQFPLPVDFVHCPELAAMTTAILRGWEAELAPSRRGGKALATISKLASGYVWRSGFEQMARSWMSEPPKGDFSALCDIHYDWSEWFIRYHTDHLCLHSAAVEIGGGAVIFPSDQKAGKSVLAMQFAQAGFRVFGDDVIAITPSGDSVMSLGLLPRLRLPLPESVDAGFVKFVSERRGPSSKHYQYMALSNEEFAPFGATVPVRALVLLDRQESGPASLSAVGQGETLKQLIRKNFADTIAVTKIFKRLKDLTGRAPGLRLKFSNGRDAVALLAKEFGGGR
jgi:hypothetical protein